ncbi:FtsW/RodA/SpoVE family cell cycle protein [Brachybacterium sp. EF45031]|uniref:FtsW/RodA/SpoVE family cell cycle protein n=1 Tax=Brachybacterium sillae TaxID=2810536 RepID=UPI00217D0F1F|nr:FtsW/RodA/SpoVE family cell cycle protein [Brachybacterium sillae]MCS6712074.1 FtsW/RodA/SpoVE family cell cycle protein [Brachybacterium sillae]
MATIVSYTARPRRILGGVLLLAALAIGLLAYVLQGLGRYDQVPADLPVVGIGAAVTAALVYAVTQWRAPFADPLIVPIAVLLNLLGIATIASYDGAVDLFTSREAAYAGRQALWAGIGMILAAAVVALLRDHRVLRRYTWVSALLGAMLLLLPLLPVVGRSINGSRIWISVAGFSFQPAELAKICFAVFFAGYLVSRRDTLALAGPKVLGVHLPRWSDFGPIVVAWAFGMAVLVFETDLGTSLLFFGLFVVMLYVATDRLSWLVIGAVMFIPPALLAVTQVTRVRTRLACWLDPLSGENYDRCYQINQGLFGMANGGLFGTGPGQARLNVVPYGHSDFIYSSLAEELGMVGVFAVLMLYLVLVERALRAAMGIADGFGTLLAGGLGFILALQVFVVVGGVTRVIPLTGLVLPFLAAGGSSLVCNWIIIGLLVRLSDAARRPTPTRRPVEAPRRAEGVPA